VRELRNVIERALILEDDDMITTRYLPRALGSEAVRESAHGNPGSTASRFALPPEGLSLEEVEMSLVRQAIAQSNGNQTRAAELLGISRDQLRYRLKKLDEAVGEVV
jgi:two-component system, NtrC family, response regulator AtoC